MSKPASCLVSLALLLAAVLVPERACAQDDERARAHFLAGRSYFEQSEYQRAAEEFMRAYALSPRPALLLNAASAHERGGALSEAVEALEAYLAAVPDAPDAATLRLRIAALQERIAAAQEPAAEPAPVAPEPAPTPPASTSRSTSGDTGLTVAGIASLAAGAAVGVAALATGLVAEETYARLEDRCGPEGTTCPAGSQSDIDSGSALATTSTVLTFVAVGALSAGAVLLVLGLTSSGGATSETSARLAPGPGDIGLSLEVDL